MTKPTSKIDQTLTLYGERLTKLNIEPRQHESGGSSRISHLEHVAWMCTQVPTFLALGKVEKAHRWLGFVQGILFLYEVFSLADLKDHNRWEVRWTTQIR
jgi:hypothetical protein